MQKRKAMIKSKNTKGLKGSVDCIDSDELKTLKADKKSLERQLAEARQEKADLIKWLDQEKQDWGSSKKDTWNPYCRVLSKLKEKGDDN